MKKRIIVILFSAFLGMTGKAAEADSLQRLAQSDIQIQLEWVNPIAIRAYLDDCREQLGERANVLYQKLAELEKDLPGVKQNLSAGVTETNLNEARGPHLDCPLQIRQTRPQSNGPVDGNLHRQLQFALFQCPKRL